MILVDSSVWIKHLRSGELKLSRLLDRTEVLMHPFVLGELALGNLSRRAELLRRLSRLPSAKTATHDEVLSLITARRLHGRGIGYVDAHLLAAALLSRAGLWTFDRRLVAVADEVVLSPGGVWN